MTIETEQLISTAAELVRLAYMEDLSSRGDITASLVHDSGDGSFPLVIRSEGVFAGQEIARTILNAFDETIELEWVFPGADGYRAKETPCHVATLHGSVRSILSAERTLLNFLQRLGGVATLTRQFVEEVSGTSAGILDTRKTIPGWRHLDKYAVRCGGGQNHRIGLYDAILIKDNHIAGYALHELADAVTAMVDQAKQISPAPSFFEIEADTIQQVEQILKIDGIDIILLDNFSVEDMKNAVAMRDAAGLQGKVQLEVSGGVTLETVRSYAETGVERISVGALTHSVSALDLALDRAV